MSLTTSFAPARTAGLPVLASTRARMLLLVVFAAAAGAGLWSVGSPASVHAVAAAGPELTRLLRAMAGLKALMALAAIAAVFWRLGAAAPLPWLAGYLAAAAAMAAGPGLIAGMDHIRTGALLLHAGLLATIVMLWRDPAMAGRLHIALMKRRAAVATDTTTSAE